MKLNYYHQRKDDQSYCLSFMSYVITIIDREEQRRSMYIIVVPRPVDKCSFANLPFLNIFISQPLFDFFTFTSKICCLIPHMQLLVLTE